MNRFQEVLCKTYAGGEFAHFANPGVAPSVKGTGDTLFEFLYNELADDGEPMGKDTAINRLETALIDVAAVVHAIK